IYDTRRQPRRGRGCVIELKTGERQVKIYKSAEGSTLLADELFPEQRTVQFNINDVAAIYPVRWRGE
ncbi:MAG: hypothetical protein ACREEW_07500, partial [Caulobacteraceae bacterium]